MNDNTPEQYLRLRPTRDSRSNTLCLVREKLLPGMIFLDAMIANDRSIVQGQERLSSRKRQVLYQVPFSDPRIRSAGPARGAPAQQ